MNQAARVVSDSLLGFDFKNVIIGDVVYTIKPPTIKVICRAIRHFSIVDLKGENIVEAIKELPFITDDLLNGLSCFLCGDESLCEQLKLGTFDEIKDALEACFSMMGVSAFQCVSSMKNVSKLAAKVKQ